MYVNIHILFFIKIYPKLNTIKNKMKKKTQKPKHKNP